MNRTNAPIYHFDKSNTGVCKFYRVSMQKISSLTLHTGHITEEPVKQVNEMAKLCEQNSSVHIFCTLPCTLIIGCGPIPKTVQLKAENAAQLFFFDHSFSKHNGWVIAILFYYKKPFPCLLFGLYHLPCTLRSNGHWLFS